MTGQGWIVDRFSLRDGACLRWGIWATPETPAGHVLFIPGRGEFIEKYDEEATNWARRGYRALALDLRGQGGSTREVPHRSHIDNFEIYLRDLEEFWAQVWLPRVKGGPAVVQGHSTGAHIALRHLARKGEVPGADALIVTAPLIDISRTALPAWAPSGLASAAIAVMGRLCPRSYAPGQQDFHPRSFSGNPLTRDEQRFTRWQNLQTARPDLASGGATWGWVLAARHSRRLLEAQLPLLAVPTLALLVPDDRIVDGPLQRCLTMARQVEFPGEGHELLQAPDEVQARLWAARDEFLAQVRKAGL